MKLFLDSSNLTEIKKAVDLELIDGVTTNPSLLAKVDTTNLDALVKEIARMVDDVSVEVTAEDFEGMIREGEHFAALSPNVTIKLPMTINGLKACKHFAKQKVRTNMTLCFSLNQALLAAKAGAYYISPFIGRLEDIGADGLALIKEIRELYNNYNYTTQILAASIRNNLHVQLVALAGAHVATMSSKILFSLVEHPLTDLGLERFQNDWQNRVSNNR